MKPHTLLRSVLKWTLAVILATAAGWLTWHHYDHPWPPGMTSNSSRPATANLRTP